MKQNTNNDMFYNILLELREEFHRFGRIDDSNAKLDEIVKLIVLGYYEATKGIKFDLDLVRNNAMSKYGDESQIALSLRDLFEACINSDIFINNDGTNIFGSNPTLNIQPTEDQFAQKLIKEISKIDFIQLVKQGTYTDFDIFNECFGHFVRENFRNNKEDAQYMTPAEISESIIEMVFNDIINETDLIKNIKRGDLDFKVMDPTCGVGTLLIETIKYFTKVVDSLDIADSNKNKVIEHFKKNGVFGQDKVDRMVRLSKINMMLIGGEISNISTGNSIVGESNIDNFAGKIDLIITNPPFGAEYDFSLLDAGKYPILNQVVNKVNRKAIVNSELALLDRCLTLLKPSGRLVIVLPDSVVSAKGIYEEYRSELIKNYEIKSIVELPAVTFAQAGTRTKTVVLYLQKNKPVHSKIVMSVCEDIGYTVKEKVGVPVKISNGKNEMIEIAQKYKSYISTNNKKAEILSHKPSITAVPYEFLIENVLNPTFYDANRLNAVYMLEELNSSGFEIKKLGDLAEFVTKKRKSYYVNDTIKHISVLHINQDGTIDFKQVEKFIPVSKGRLCEKGDVLFSKINPRIPRIAVVPDTNYQVVCSAEFEILKPKKGLSPFFIAAVLRLSGISQQIENLTSGTSSSHNRIKTEQLQDILIPIPKDEKKLQEINKIADKIEEAIKKKYAAEEVLNEEMDKLEKILL